MGWVTRHRPELVRTALAASLIGGAAGTLALAAAASPALDVVGAILVGLAAGVPFAPVFVGAAVARPDSPGMALGFINQAATLASMAGTALLGLTFSLPGNGRIGFAALGVLWALALFALPRAEPHYTMRP